MTHRYDIPRISPKQFLLEVMWDKTVDLPLRVDAADKVSHHIQPGDFCEPSLSYVIPEMVLQ